MKVVYLNIYEFLSSPGTANKQRDTFDSAQVWQCNAAEKSVMEARLHQLCRAPRSSQIWVKTGRGLGSSCNQRFLVARSIFPSKHCLGLPICIQFELELIDSIWTVLGCSLAQILVYMEPDSIRFTDLHRFQPLAIDGSRSLRKALGWWLLMTIGAWSFNWLGDGSHAWSCPLLSVARTAQPERFIETWSFGTPVLSFKPLNLPSSSVLLNMQVVVALVLGNAVHMKGSIRFCFGRSFAKCRGND